MRTTVTARHCEIPDVLRSRARVILERLAQHASRPVDGAVVFDVDGIARIAEVRVHLSTGELCIAKGNGVDHRTALDRAEGKLRRQLAKSYPRTRRTRRSVTDSV